MKFKQTVQLSANLPPHITKIHVNPFCTSGGVTQTA
jgi:hypothetical protein